MNVQNRDGLIAQIQVNETKAKSTIAEMRLELEQSHIASEEAKKLHLKQNTEIEKLKVDLANKTATLETELNNKLEVSRQR